MKIRMLSTLAMLLSWSSASQGEEDPIAKCLAKYSNAAAGPCLESVVEVAELKLKHSTENLTLLLKSLERGDLPRIRAAGSLKSAQDEWEEYRDKECAFIGSVTMWGGSGTSNAIVRCVAMATDARRGRLETLTKKLRRLHRE